MINHWYISTDNKFPDVITKQVYYVGDHSVLELTSKCNHSTLIYLGRGRWDVEHIQTNYEKYHDAITWR